MMVCPLCKKKMKKIKIENIVLEECFDGCHGLWFDIWELEKLDEKHEGEGLELQRILSYERADDLDHSRRIMCPKCNVQMERHEYINRSKIFIDECLNCGGVWLDQGELSVIRENFKGYEHVGDIVDKMLQGDSVFQSYLSKKGHSENAIRRLSRISLFR